MSFDALPQRPVMDLNSKSEVADYWPFPDKPLRVTQEEAFKWLQDKTHKYIILQIPVGGGKSNIGVTLSRWLTRGSGNSYVLTPQRILQEQYEKSFPDHMLASLYGKSNYQCANRNTTCDIGSLVKPSCGACPHAAAKATAKRNPNVVLNYKLALLTFSYTQSFGRRELMVLDEAHNIEEELTEFDAITIGQKRCEKYKINWKKFTELKDAIKWVKNVYLDVVSKKLDELIEETQDLIDAPLGRNLTPAEVNKIREVGALSEHVDNLCNLCEMKEEQVQNTYVLVYESDYFKFKRLTGEHSFKRILEPYANKFLFMSSTILNYRAFCKDIGIDPTEAVYLELESEFPEDNRPVYYMPVMKMNASWKQDDRAHERKKMVNKVVELLEMHEGDNGIIHSGNFAIAQWLVEELEGRIGHQIFHHNPGSGDDRNAIINAFQKNKLPSLLISPSITEGLDLIGDLGRFAIFAKIPFGFLGDQWIKRRMELSAEWYRRQAIIDVIQGCGRVVRSKDDWGNVYILDSSFSFLYSQSLNMIPQWWKDAYCVVD